MDVAEQHPQTHPAAFQASLKQALEDLPTHCLRSLPCQAYYVLEPAQVFKFESF